MATELSDSAEKTSRGLCQTICPLLPTLVYSGIKCQYCRCRARREHIIENQTKLLDSGAVATQDPLISRTGTLPHELPLSLRL